TPLRAHRNNHGVAREIHGRARRIVNRHVVASVPKRLIHQLDRLRLRLLEIAYARLRSLWGSCGNLPCKKPKLKCLYDLRGKLNGSGCAIVLDGNVAYRE